MVVLALSDIRKNDHRTCEHVCKADTYEEMEAFLNAEVMPPYDDEGYQKYFRKGSMLEYYLRPLAAFKQGIHDLGDPAEWSQELSDAVAAVPYYSYT